MRKYKEWGNDMYPMNFRNFMQKLEKMSGKRQIQDELQRIRNKRDGFVDEPFLGNFSIRFGQSTYFLKTMKANFQ